MRHFDLLFFVILLLLLWRRLRLRLLLLLLLHTHSHTAMQAMHTPTHYTYIHVRTHRSTRRRQQWLTIFFLLVTCVVYNLTQFNYIRIAVRYMYFGQNEERERDDLVRQLTKLFGYLNLLLYLLLCCPYNFFLLSVCLCVRACE